MARTLAPLGERYEVKIDRRIFNAAFLPYLELVKPYEVYYGGSGSGKSNFVAHKLALQLTTMAGRNLVCLRTQEKDCRDSCYPEIEGAMDQLGLLPLWKVVEHPSVRMTNRVNGNQILFTGMDDVENIKSIKFKRGTNLTDVWYEEVSEETDVRTIRELDRRLRDPRIQGRIVMTFNPVSRTHWLKEFIEKELNGLDAIVHRSTYRDNRFLPESYGAKLERFRYTDPYAYQVYALGEWGSMGQSVFDQVRVHARMLELMSEYEAKPPRRYGFSFTPDGDGFSDVKEYEDPDGECWEFSPPAPGVPYVLAFDTAGEGSDFFYGHVLDNRTRDQVAKFRSVRLPNHCMPQLYLLGRKYNFALICPEVNFNDYPLEKLKEWGYPNIYQRQTRTENYASAYEPKLGWRTQSDNRQGILSECVAFVNDNTRLIHDIDLLDECLTFTRQQKKLKGIWLGAEPGAHDDGVMAYAIVLQACDQQYTEVQVPRKALTGFWFPEELDMAVESGKLTEEDAQAYRESNRDRLEAMGGESRWHETRRYR